MTDRWFAGRIDMIIHAAATIYGVKGFNTFCADILGDDITMTRNILRFAMLNDVKKFVYISSSMVYERCWATTGGVSEREVFDINFPVPLTDYGLSKYTGERMVKAFNRQYGLNYVIWRPFNIITPYERARNEVGVSHVFADFFNAILVKKKKTIPIIAPGTQTRCFTWIGDVAKAIAAYSETANGEYNIGSTEEISMTDLARKIYHMAGNPMQELMFEYLPPIDNDVMRRVPNVSKIKEELGWSSWVDLTTAIKRCIEQYNK
jgi:nucleoside-diphosphate-sugar epimerase